MNLDDIVQKNIQEKEKDIKINKLRKEVIKNYEELLDVISYKEDEIFRLMKSKCISEIDIYLKEKGFAESNKNENGSILVLSDVKYYKKSNTLVKINFSSNEEIEYKIIIDVINGDTKKNVATKSLTFKLDGDSDNMLSCKYPIKVGDEYLYLYGYETPIEKCADQNELLQLKGIIKENIEYIEKNTKDNNKFEYVYEDKRKNQFKTFKQAFEHED